MTGLFTAAAPISPVLGSSIAGTLAEVDGLRGWHGWQWIFGRKPSQHWSWASVVLFCLTKLPEPDDPACPSALRSPASVLKGDRMDILSSLAMGISLASSFASLGRPGT